MEIVIRIQVPDGAQIETVTTSAAAEDSPPPRLAALPAPPSAGGGAVADGSPPVCPHHHIAMRTNRRGFYCPSKDDVGGPMSNGFCDYRPPRAS